MLEIVLKVVILPALLNTVWKKMPQTKNKNKTNPKRTILVFFFPSFFFFFFFNLSTGFVGSVCPHFKDEETEAQRY